MEQLLSRLNPHEIEMYFDMQADFFKALANKNRLKILYYLREKQEVKYSELLTEMKISKATLSHHLAILRKHKLVKSIQHGREVTLKLNCEETLGICSIVEKVINKKLEETLSTFNKLTSSLNPAQD